MAIIKNEDTVVDAADSTPRFAGAKGKRVKALPFANGTTVIVRKSDFADAGKIDHEDVTWDFRVDDFTVAVGDGISQEAADFLTSKFADSFVYVTE